MSFSLPLRYFILVLFYSQYGLGWFISGISGAARPGTIRAKARIRQAWSGSVSFLDP